MSRGRPGFNSRPRSFRVRQFEAELHMPERHAAFDGKSVSSSSLSFPSWCLLRIILCLLVSGHALPTLALLLHKLIALTLCPGGLRGWTQVPLAQAAWVQIQQVSSLQHGLPSGPPGAGNRARAWYHRTGASIQCLERSATAANKDTAEECAICVSFKYLHQPGIEPGSHRWQRCILPLDH